MTEPERPASKRTGRITTGAKRRTPRERGGSLLRMLPNMITVAATCAALTGVRLALEGRFEFAVTAILLAAVLDGLDGRMARLLNAASAFGEQMDSLSDVVAFGVSPALILYYWKLSEIGEPVGGIGGGFGWIAALFLAVCCGLRLARFNSRLDALPAYAYNYFQGVPAPAGAMLALMPLILSFVLIDTLKVTSIVIPPIAVAIWTVAVGLLMVSELPTFSLKKVRVRPSLVLPILALAAFSLSGLAGAPWITLLILLVAYLASFPVSLLSYRRLAAAAQGLRSPLPSTPSSNDASSSDRKEPE